LSLLAPEPVVIDVVVLVERERIALVAQAVAVAVHRAGARDLRAEVGEVRHAVVVDVALVELVAQVVDAEQGLRGIGEIHTQLVERLRALHPDHAEVRAHVEELLAEFDAVAQAVHHDVQLVSVDAPHLPGHAVHGRGEGRHQGALLVRGPHDPARVLDEVGAVAVGERAAAERREGARLEVAPDRRLVALAEAQAQAVQPDHPVQALVVVLVEALEVDVDRVAREIAQLEERPHAHLLLGRGRERCHAGPGVGGLGRERGDEEEQRDDGQGGTRMGRGAHPRRDRGCPVGASRIGHRNRENTIPARFRGLGTEFPSAPRTPGQGVRRLGEGARAGRRLKRALG
jgi:hypothetical protein